MVGGAVGWIRYTSSPRTLCPSSTCSSPSGKQLISHRPSESPSARATAPPSAGWAVPANMVGVMRSRASGWGRRSGLLEQSLDDRVLGGAEIPVEATDGAEELRLHEAH